MRADRIPRVWLRTWRVVSVGVKAVTRGKEDDFIFGISYGRTLQALFVRKQS